MEVPLKLQVLSVAWQQVTGDGMKPGAGMGGVGLVWGSGRLVSRPGPHGRVVTASGSQRGHGQGAKGGMKVVTWGLLPGGPARPGSGATGTGWELRQMT